MDMHLQFLRIQTLNKYGVVSPNFLVTFIFVNGANVDRQDPKNNALIITFNYETHFL